MIHGYILEYTHRDMVIDSMKTGLLAVIMTYMVSWKRKKDLYGGVE